MPRALIVTLLIGDTYRQMWRRYCERSWRAYAQVHGFDVLVHEEIIDRTASPKHLLTWQKLLIGELEAAQAYDVLIWIDADIVINTLLMPPDILAGMPEDKIGGVRYHALLSFPMFELAHRRMCRGLDARAFKAGIYGDHRLEADPDSLLNSGVLVIPCRQAPFLRDVYMKYRDVTPNPQQQEQPFLSYELHKAGLMHFLDEKFNAVWYEYKESVYWGDKPPEQFQRVAVQRILSQVYFLHFAGTHKDMALLD